MPKDPQDISRDGLVATLRWYAEMGVDIALDPAPHDFIAEARAGQDAGRKPPPTAREDARPPAPGPASRPAAREPPSIESAGVDAREAAASARNLDELRERLLSFEGCGLKGTATQLVFGDGAAGADVMFVGEAPGADEDRQGTPFVGRAGKLLNLMIASIGLERCEVYICNVVPWRPPGNRTPTPLETAACLPFIRRQIELVGPKILVCLGMPAAQTLLDSKEGITRLRGRWFDYICAERTIQALAMFHPAYLLRQPAQKRLAWRDLRLLAKELARLRGASAPASDR